MPEIGRSRDRDPPPTSKRNSITERIRGTFGQARKETAASVQRRTSSASKQSPVLRIREWLDTCNTEHQHHCHPDSDAEVKTWRPVFLIDCVDRRLVRAKPTDRYLALSYVWGTPMRRNESPPTALLLKSNVEAFESILPEDDMPQTFLDAIWLSKKLGIRHLWVDRLCIVQDDEEDQENTTRHMAFVFSNAYLTIVAAHGDADSGLTALNPKQATRSIRSGGPDHNELVTTSKWNMRGWTLQEYLYSRRKVFFFADLVTWECHCELWQGSTSGVVKAIRGNRHTCVEPVQPATCAFHHAPWPDLDEYARIVMDFSARRLSIVDDTLRAFNGITQVLSNIYPGGFIYGMPLMFLDIALLWRPQASVRRRAMSRPPFLPSWSWMGWWFDNVPVDLILWRAAADFVEEAKPDKRGPDTKRFRSPHHFKIKPTVTWSMTDRVSTAPIESSGLQYRDLRSRRTTASSLPKGWKRSGSHFHHDSDESTTFRYPIPVEDPPEVGEYAPPPGEKAFPGPFLAFRTTAGFFEVDFLAVMAPRDSMNPPISVGNIWSKTNRWAGQFRAHDGWLGIQSSNFDGEEKLEFIAISTATERRGSHVFDVERFEEHMDADEMVDIVNVLWIERITGVAYRRGIGHILQKVWDTQAKDELDILLG